MSAGASRVLLLARVERKDHDVKAAMAVAPRIWCAAGFERAQEKPAAAYGVQRRGVRGQGRV